MNAATIIVIVILAAMITLAIIAIVRSRNRCSCCRRNDTCPLRKQLDRQHDRI